MEGLKGYAGMSRHGLLDIHKAIRERLQKEDVAESPQARVHGVREFPDWKEQADAIEAELSKRNVPYEKIKWK